ncbi:MAG: hypothetical protein U1B94_00315 [candidate division NC10 bacterium]|nr:hypothetical protein [candidate division NC10 bacterium]
MIKTRWLLLILLIGLSALWSLPAHAACTQSVFAVMVRTMVIGAKVLVVWSISPPCDVIETGLLMGVDPATLAPVGQPIYGYRAAYQQEIPVAESGQYWLAAYVRDEAGGTVQSQPRPAKAMGTLEKPFSDGGQAQASCSLENFDAEGMGSYTMAYHSSEVGGAEKIVASAAGFSNAEAKVRVEVLEVPGLVELPEEPAKYVRVGTPNSHAGTNDPCTPQAQAPTSRHFKSFYGLPKLKEAVEQIAATMLQQTGILLRVNDMSLPPGGLFDIDNNWRTNHKTHRVGRHVDIGFSGVRNGVCTAYNLRDLRAAIRDATKRDPELELGAQPHFHAFIP